MLNKSQGKQKQRVEQPCLLQSFTPLFYMCKMLGSYPYDFAAFKNFKVIQKSRVGMVIVLLGSLIIFGLYILMVYTFDDTDEQSAKKNNLSLIIGMVLSNMGALMLLVDQLNILCNQTKFVTLFERVQLLDDELLQQCIVMDNRLITRRVRYMLALTVLLELTVFLNTYLKLVDYTEWISILWVLTNITTLYNTLDKIWFLALLMALKERFMAINLMLESVVEEHELVETIENNGHLVKVTTLDVLQIKHLKNKVSPMLERPPDYEEHAAPPSISYKSVLDDTEKIERKLMRLCQIHDTACSLAELLNQLWSYPLLMLMAYGFVVFTAQLYFLYCAAESQFIPSVFRSAKIAYITIIYLIYIAGKCIALMYWSRSTSLEAKRTGVCLHKCGVAANRNDIYEIVNHLSLKLLNHNVDFSACGFFTLDMETLFAVCGGITSYLIIFIQFNMAGQQAKLSNTLTTNNHLNDTEQLVHNLRNVTNYFDYVLFYPSFYN